MKLLIHIRRISNLLDNAIRNGPDGTLEGKFGAEHPEFTHYSLVFYLAGCMAYMENEGGTKSWKGAGANHTDFDSFISSLPSTNRFRTEGLSKASLEALSCIRNACIHNADDLSKNRDQNSLGKVQSANLPGVSINGSKVLLEHKFLEFTRLSTLAVRNYHGEA